MHKSTIFLLLQHYLDKCLITDQEMVLDRYEEFIDFLTEMLVEEVFQ